VVTHPFFFFSFESLFVHFSDDGVQFSYTECPNTPVCVAPTQRSTAPQVPLGSSLTKLSRQVVVSRHLCYDNFFLTPCDRQPPRFAFLSRTSLRIPSNLPHVPIRSPFPTRIFLLHFLFLGPSLPHRLVVVAPFETALIPSRFPIERISPRCLSHLHFFRF